jgi:hypothetical protein
MNPPTPQAIMEWARNFMESRVLLTGAELNLFTLLACEPLSAEEVASRTGANIRALTILLDALAAMELLVKKEGRYSSPQAISSLLLEKSPESILPMVHHMAHLWQRWSKLTERVAGREEPGKHIESQETNQMTAFIGAMDAIAARLAPGVVAAVNPGVARTLLDVGGASGTYSLAFLRAVPEMRATLFDKPEVVPIARRRLEKKGVLDRITLVGGDFYRDEFPPGHDLALISAIIHQNSPGENLDLYRKVFRALLPAGRIIIRDHIMEPHRTRPRDGAIFAVNMLVATRGGNTYTFEEIRTGLVQAGFVRIRLLQRGERMDGLVEGFKPS